MGRWSLPLQIRICFISLAVAALSEMAVTRRVCGMTTHLAEEISPRQIGMSRL